MCAVEDHPSQTAIRVLTTSDSPFSAECLQGALLHYYPSWIVAAAAPDDSIAKATEQRPDVILIHLPSDWAKALDLARATSARMPETRIVMLGVPDGDQSCVQCVEAGASGWVSELDSFSRLKEVLSVVRRGELACSPRLAYLLFERLTQLAADTLPLADDASAGSLTANDLEVLDLMAADKANEEIAAHLHLSLPAVKRRMRRALSILDLDRSQLHSPAAGPLCYPRVIPNRCI